MKYIKTLRKTREGGSCSNCNESYRAENGKRILASYKEKDSVITEPFNLCKDCYDEITKQMII